MSAQHLLAALLGAPPQAAGSREHPRGGGSPLVRCLNKQRCRCQARPIAPVCAQPAPSSAIFIVRQQLGAAPACVLQRERLFAIFLGMVVIYYLFSSRILSQANTSLHPELPGKVFTQQRVSCPGISNDHILPSISPCK